MVAINVDNTYGGHLDRGKLSGNLSHRDTHASRQAKARAHAQTEARAKLLP